ncbi:hypothetical protein PL11_005190 [Lentilactobacillus curieae]|uniref:Peptidase M10 metallopeptidase domain-containing protein n=1 Tax=Lentilactobacillus curieae TaxID=1138822 RepID=A0A1S6QID9_9LACO|nr:M57 family metalloprotease [Lentilactobacillus curieae]AQW21367.1 hypothetical protein PL11_005190 [Lentilactobacillus curieae]
MYLKPIKLVTIIATLGIIPIEANASRANYKVNRLGRITNRNYRYYKRIPHPKSKSLGRLKKNETFLFDQKKIINSRTSYLHFYYVGNRGAWINSKAVSFSHVKYQPTHTGRTVSKPKPVPVTPISDNKWSTKNINVFIENMDSDYQSIWQNAVNKWNQTNVVSLNLVSSKQSADVTLQTQSERPKDFQSPTTTGCSYFSSNHHRFIKARGILLSHPLAEANYSTHQKENVATHELGHILGLKHNDVSPSVMNPNVCDEQISASDIAALKTIYS